MDLVIITVYNRPRWMLENVLRQLQKNDLTDTRVLIVDDGSTCEFYPLDLPDYHLIKASTIEARPDTYQIGGHNNPAYVNNVALAWAKEHGARRLFFLSSDVLLPPNTLTRARKYVDKGCCYVPSVVDIDTSQLFLGSQRMFPMMWFYALPAAVADAAGPFDEEFLKGMAFEDNDWTGRTALEAGKMALDESVIALHQSHPGVAYSDDMQGFKRSEKYCLKKWEGNIPWGRNMAPFSWRGTRNDEGVSEFVVESVVYA